MFDSSDSLVALADSMGVHPCCGRELGDCTCVEDRELAAEVHPHGCMCCASDVIWSSRDRLAMARSLGRHGASGRKGFSPIYSSVVG